MKKLTRRNFLKLAAAGPALSMAMAMQENHSLQAYAAKSSKDSPDDSSEITLTFAAGFGEDSAMGKRLEKISELVKLYTNDRVHFDIYYYSLLGDDFTVLDSVSEGTVDICSCASSSLMNEYVPECTVFEKPFLWESLEMVDFAMSHKTGELIQAGVEAAGLHMLTWLDTGFYDLFTFCEIKTKDDLTGLKIRTASSAYSSAIWNSFGADATVLAFSEVYTSLMNYIVDGIDTTLSIFDSNHFYELLSYCCRTNHITRPAIICMSDSAYQKVAALGEDVLDGFLKAFSEGQEEQRQYPEEEEEETIGALKDMGITFTTLSDEDMEDLKGQYEDYISDDPSLGVSYESSWLKAVEEDAEAFSGCGPEGEYIYYGNLSDEWKEKVQDGVVPLYFSMTAYNDWLEASFEDFMGTNSRYVKALKPLTVEGDYTLLTDEIAECLRDLLAHNYGDGYESYYVLFCFVLKSDVYDEPELPPIPSAGQK